jgi:hypothetical protein
MYDFPNSRHCLSQQRKAMVMYGEETSQIVLYYEYCALVLWKAERQLELPKETSTEISCPLSILDIYKALK